METKTKTNVHTVPEGSEPVRYSSLKAGSHAKPKAKTNLRAVAEKYLIFILLLFGIYFAVCIGWNLIELAIAGSAQQTTTDGIVAIIMAVSLFHNLDHWIKGGK